MSAYPLTMLHTLSALVLAQPLATLTGFSAFPADSFGLPIRSGLYLGEPINDRTSPFFRQPVQGLSGLLHLGGDRYLGLSDNGFGAKGNSADFVLAVHRFRVPFDGPTTRIHTVPLRDPRRLVPWELLADRATYPDKGDPVDPRIRGERLLTGWDFDVESIQEGPDGTLWIGDEFGPFLLNFSRQGELLAPPYPLANRTGLPGSILKSPQSPLLTTGEVPQVNRSSGFEGIAILPGGRRLLAVLESALAVDPNKNRLWITEFDLARRAYTQRAWAYRLDGGTFMGDVQALSSRHLLFIERDPNEGDEAKIKRLYLADMQSLDAEGFMRKRLVADLLAIDDPQDLDGDGARQFRFPFETIESVVVLDSQTLVLVNDNNYPWSTGRKQGVPEASEFIRIRLASPLPK